MADLGEAAAQLAEARAQWRDAVRGEHRLIVAQLVERRIMMNLTQEQIAAQVGVSRGQIANAESGKSMLSVEALIGYAYAVQVRLTLSDR